MSPLEARSVENQEQDSFAVARESAGPARPWHSVARNGQRRNNAAFTLIELLVVMAIIGLLASMILATLTAGQNAGDINDTRAMLGTIAVALDRFVDETGSVPRPTGSRTDVNSGDWYPTTNDGAWDKQQLWWRLNYEMDTAERVAMRDAGLVADIAADPYQNSNYTVYGLGLAGFKAAMLAPNDLYGKDDAYFENTYRGESGLSNWLKSSGSGTVPDGYVPLVVNGGSVSLSWRGFYKTHYLAIQGAIAKDLAERRYLSHACIELDDLADEKFIDGDAIVDAWQNPIIYVGYSTVSYPFSKPVYSAKASIGAHVGGRATVRDRNGDGAINLKDWDTPPPVDEQVDHNGIGGIDADDWASVLWNATPGYESSYFIASAGVDGQFSCILSDDMNSDNIGIRDKD